MLTIPIVKIIGVTNLWASFVWLTPPVVGLILGPFAGFLLTFSTF